MNLVVGAATKIHRQVQGRVVLLDAPGHNRWPTLLSLGDALFGRLDWWPGTLPGAGSMLVSALLGSKREIPDGGIAAPVPQIWPSLLVPELVEDLPHGERLAHDRSEDAPLGQR